MKLITLNIWGGRKLDQLLSYIKEHKETDIFCFQEVFDSKSNQKVISEHYCPNIFSEIQQILPDHIGHFAPAQENWGYNGFVDFKVQFGIAIFVKKSIKVLKVDSDFAFRYFNARESDNTTLGKRIQSITFKQSNITTTICNVHGLWNGQGKSDTQNRLNQSKEIIKFLSKQEGRKILCGDFNLMPETKSLKILEEGRINLIKTFNIKSTRSELYKKPLKYADYTLTSPEIIVKHFEVPMINISDHLPMILEFE